MVLSGHFYYITDAKQAFIPVLLGDQAPTTGFVPWPNSTVSATYFWSIGGLGLGASSKATATVGADGSFTLPPPPQQPFGSVNSVSLVVTSGVPVYRTGLIPFNVATSKPLNIWVYVDKLPTSDGITAGTVSQQVNGQGLPGNTTITAGGPYGLNFAGSDGQVNINFNISVAPDTSNNLADFLDLAINGWNINVGWPTSWFESANDVLNKIKSGIAGAGTNVNKAVLQLMAKILTTEEGISEGMAETFVNNEVSVVFYGVGYPNKHSWGIGNTTDSTVVLVANPCIGFPRSF